VQRHAAALADQCSPSSAALLPEVTGPKCTSGSASLGVLRPSGWPRRRLPTTGRHLGRSCARSSHCHDVALVGGAALLGVREALGRPGRSSRRSQMPPAPCGPRAPPGAAWRCRPASWRACGRCAARRRRPARQSPGRWDSASPQARRPVRHSRVTRQASPQCERLRQREGVEAVLLRGLGDHVGAGQAHHQLGVGIVSACASGRRATISPSVGRAPLHAATS